MTATAHTHAMIDWWATSGLARADLAVRRHTGSLIWHRDVALEALPLAWARAENAHQADVYIRPARGAAWPVAFVDDVAPDRARHLAGAHDVLVVETSPQGGCHVWLACDRPLTEDERAVVQRWWVARLDGDPASVSGEHLGRLAGFKNWKRHGCWVNVRAASRASRPWNPAVALAARPPSAIRAPARYAPHPGNHDTSPSGRDWGWVCALLEAGLAPHVVYAQLVQRAQRRRGADAERYARRTTEKAVAHVERHRTVDLFPSPDTQQTR
jgi:hypothetical protein